MHVGEALGLDVTRVVKVALDEALAATEGCDGLANRGVEQLRNLLEGAGNLQATTAATECSLDSNREAVLLREFDNLAGILDGIRRAGNLRGACALRDVTSGDFVTE
jgi:hypothetical protein